MNFRKLESLKQKRTVPIPRLSEDGNIQNAVLTFNNNVAYTCTNLCINQTLDQQYANVEILDYNGNDYSIIEPSTRQTTFTMSTTTRTIVDYLNTFTNVYIESNLEKKNKIATKTIDFIDNQLNGISDSLFQVESTLQNFRTSNKIMDLSIKSNEVFSNLTQLENEKAILIIQSKYYDYFKKSIEKNNLTDLLAPSTVGINNTLLSSFIISAKDKNTALGLKIDAAEFFPLKAFPEKPNNIFYNFIIVLIASL
jgi:hypothetical protein